MSGKKERLRRQAKGVKMWEVRAQATIRRIVEQKKVDAEVERVMEEKA